MATIADILARQYRQQESIFGPLPRDRTERKLLAQRMATYAMDEVFEYLRASSYKHYLPLDEAPRMTRLIEIIDIFKYVLAVAWTEEMTAEELEQLFQQKTEVVDQRLAAADGLCQSGAKVCGFDIDGVLAKTHPAYRSDASEEEKEALFESGITSQLEPADGAHELLWELKDQGWGIVLVTSRKVWRHARTEHETYEWLQRHGLPFDRVLFGYDKGELIAKSNLKLAFFVEDSVKHAVDLADNGLQVFLIGHPEVQHERIISLDSIRALGRHIANGGIYSAASSESVQ